MGKILISRCELPITKIWPHQRHSSTTDHRSTTYYHTAQSLVPPFPDINTVKLSGEMPRADGLAFLYSPRIKLTEVKRKTIVYCQKSVCSREKSLVKLYFPPTRPMPQMIPQRFSAFKSHTEVGKSSPFSQGICSTTLHRERVNVVGRTTPAGENYIS